MVIQKIQRPKKQRHRIDAKIRNRVIFIIMEEGSLLQIALNHVSSLKDSHDNLDRTQKDCLLLDLYSLKEHPEPEQQQHHLLYLAELAEKCNTFLQSQDYLWHYGIDVPNFGIHVSSTEGIPHLRAYCRYGPNVLDEWMAIHYLIEISKKYPDIAGMAWDIQDGQVILIQLADILPDWLDEDPSDNHRYACWIQNGNIQLFHESHLTLQKSLELLRNNSNSMESTHPTLQQALVYWLEVKSAESKLLQRTPMVLPRNVARFFNKRPELVHTAIQAFGEYLDINEEEATEIPSIISTT